MMGLGLGLMRKLARRSSAIPNFGGVLLQHDGSTAANYSAGTNLSWSTEVYDTDTYHEAVTNPSRITIPSGVAYARLRSGIQLDSLGAAAGVGLQIQKNNSGSYAGRGRSTGTNTANTTGFVSTQTAILPVSAGDYFETRLTVSDSSVDLNASTSYFSLEKIESVRGCLLAHSGSTGVDGSALRTFSFTTETYDTDGLHEGVTNPSRITIPAGVEYARLSGCAVFNNVVSSSTCNVVITKNGSDDYVGVAQRVSVGGSGTTPVAWSVESPVIPVVEGDYFELKWQAGADTSMDIIADETWFACEIITSVTGALVYYGTTTALADYTAGYAIPFNSETYDTGNFHSTSSNTERFTVAGGASKVRVSAGVELLSVTGNTTTVRLRKNGAAFVGAPGHCASNAGGGPYYNVVSAVVNVQSGDYFDVYLTTADVSAQIVQTATWFAIEVVAA